MAEISYRRHRFRQLSYSTPCGSTCVSRPAFEKWGELLTERGLDVFYETVRSWVLKFGDRATARAARSSAEQPMAPGRDG
jgi:hypothetical protein